MSSENRQGTQIKKRRAARAEESGRRQRHFAKSSGIWYWGEGGTFSALEAGGGKKQRRGRCARNER